MITVLTTANANALKFVVDRRWIEFVWECHNEKDAAKSQLAKKLFQLKLPNQDEAFNEQLSSCEHISKSSLVAESTAIVYMLFGYDFVSVSKKQETSWDDLEPEIIEIIDAFLQRKIGLLEDEHETKRQCVSDKVSQVKNCENQNINCDQQNDKDKNIIQTEDQCISQENGCNHENEISYSEIEIKIINVLKEKVQPAIEAHGGMVKYISFIDGVVMLNLRSRYLDHVFHPLDEKLSCATCALKDASLALQIHPDEAYLQGACGCPNANYTADYTLKQGIENLLKCYFPQIKKVVNVENIKE